MLSLDRPHRPLRLRFSVPEQPRRLAPWPTVQWPSAERSDQPTDLPTDSGYKRKKNEDWVQAGLPRWIEAGLEAVEMVVHHEKSMMTLWNEREEAAIDRLMVLRKLVASMAAKDAFRDAIVLVRANEDKRRAGTVATGALGPANMTPFPEPEP